MFTMTAFLGLSVALLFAAAGYRAVGNQRKRALRKKIVYRGKLGVIYHATVTRGVLTASSMIKHAALANSMKCVTR